MTIIMTKKILDHYEKVRQHNRELRADLQAKKEELAKYWRIR